jgi:hypothetical protein
MPIKLIRTRRTDLMLVKRMNSHYSQPKGFVGRNICYAVYYDDIYYGHIVGGSATRFLPGRNEYLHITIKQLNNVVNNIFFNVSKVDNKYPCRKFTSTVVQEFVKTISLEWYEKYGDKVLGFETLVEKPRTGELYKRAGWTCVGETLGYTCKRLAGKGSDNWSGKRVWDTNKNTLRPKLVFCLRNTNNECIPC